MCPTTRSRIILARATKQREDHSVTHMSKNPPLFTQLSGCSGVFAFPVFAFLVFHVFVSLVYLLLSFLDEFADVTACVFM